MPKCTFCGEMLRKGTGKMFVHTDGRISYFCSMKCEKNSRKLKRNPRHIVWTKRYQDLKKAGQGSKPAEKEEPKKKEEKKAKKK